MKNILIVVVILFLLTSLVLFGCAKKGQEQAEPTKENEGIDTDKDLSELENIDKDLDTNELEGIDKDLEELNW